MSNLEPLADTVPLVEQIAHFATRTNHTFGTAESLTGGHIASHLAAGPDAGIWLKGGIVAYQPSVKYGLLNVPPGPVVSAPSALAMARSARHLLAADFTVAVTGAGGPEPQDGQPPGTVFMAVIGPPTYENVTEHHFPGPVDDVLAATIIHALAGLVAAITR